MTQDNTVRVSEERISVLKKKQGIEAYLSACSEEHAVASAIARSGLFDVDWYLKEYRDVETSDLDPILHYVRYGEQEGRKPAPWFDAGRYHKENRELLNQSGNCFYHYLYSDLLIIKVLEKNNRKT